MKITVEFGTETDVIEHVFLPAVKEWAEDWVSDDEEVVVERAQ